MKLSLLATALALLVAMPTFAAEGWVELFNGRDLSGWRPNTQPEAFSVVDGAIRARATQPYAHLFYIGDGSPEAGRFRNFELEAVVRGEPSSNSGIYFHTDMASGEGPRLKLTKGYEVQLNNVAKEKRKTGSLYAVVDLAESPVDETQWFTVRIRVEGRRIGVWVNERQTVDYTEPDKPPRLKGFEGRLLSPEGGSIALQAHDPDSVYYFQRVRVRRLP